MTEEHVPSGSVQTTESPTHRNSVEHRQTVADRPRVEATAGWEHREESLSLIITAAPPSLLRIYNMAVVRLEEQRTCFHSLVVQRDQVWRGGSSSIQKYIVQQFSCHSKHSYLSINGPVTSAAIQKKKTKLHKTMIKRLFLQQESQTMAATPQRADVFYYY